jgi:hypothetical protein
MRGNFSKEVTITIFLFLICSSITIFHVPGSELEISNPYINRSSYTYHNYTSLVQDLESLNTTYPEIFELSTAQSEFGLPDCKDGYKIWIIRITNEALGLNKPEVLFIGGHHGNEDISIETPYYFAEWLVTSYDNDEHVRYLIDHREIYIMPVINPYGWENDIREDGNNEDPNRDYPYANTSYNQALTTLGAKAVHELMSRHLFITALSWHSGLQAIYYAWGTPVHDTPTDEAPDTVAFYEQARLMSAKGGSFGGKYEFGPANEVVYGVRGAWSDYAYAATWDSQYTAPEFSTNGSRTLAIGVEISNDLAPVENTLGNSAGIYDPGGTDDGWVPKNIRMAMVLVDNAEPYINLVNRDNIPKLAYPGQNITLEWEVMGAFKADETRSNYELDWNGKSPSTIDQYQTTTQNGWSGWYGNTFSEYITMPTEEGDYYFVVSASVDRDTLEQTAPDPDVEPQSLYVNQRTNASWEFSNNGNEMKGQVVWYSEVIHIEVQESGFVQITDHPQIAETSSTVQLNWTVSVSSNYVLNKTQVRWGNSTNPMNNSYDIINGIKVSEQVVESNIVYNYFSNITMPLETGKYYFIVNALLNDIQTQSIQHELWSQVVQIEVELPPYGYQLEVSTPVVKYIGNLTQQIDITEVNVACPALGLTVCDDEMLIVHEYYIYNYDNMLGRSGNLSWNGNFWQVLNVNVSAFPEHMYYVTCYFELGNGNGSNNHTEGDSSEFSVNHILIISQPILEVTDGKIRNLNITNITGISSYQLSKKLELGNITKFRFTIENYTNHWKPILLGELNWTGNQWQALNINLSEYGKGEYRVKFSIYSIYDYQYLIVNFNLTYMDVIEEYDEDIPDSEQEDNSIYYLVILILIILSLIILFYISRKSKPGKK